MTPSHCHVTTGDGLRLHAIDYQPASAARHTIICLPGLTRNARDFEALAPRLAVTHRVICLDQRGRGHSDYAADPMSYVPQSYVNDLAILIGRLAPGPVVLIGTSLGALVATLFAAMRPEIVAGLVLNDSGPDIDPRGLARIGGYVGQPASFANWQEAAQFVARQDAVVYPDYTPADWLRLAHRRFIEDEPGLLRLDYDMAIARPFSSPATTPDQWPFFRQLRPIPTLVLRGAESDILSAATLAAMHDAVPDLISVEVPGRGHAPSLDEPEALAAIDRLLATAPPRIGPFEYLRRRIRARRFAPVARQAGLKVPPTARPAAAQGLGGQHDGR